MAKKFSKKILIICLVVVFVAVSLTTCLVLIFAKAKKHYVGYDGYVWYGDERTDQLSDEKVFDDDAFEHTLEIAGTMSKYFDGKYVDISNSFVALLPHYQKYSNTVIFSKMKIKSITVVAKKKGTLDVSIAKIEDVVNSRTGQTPLNAKKVNTFQVTKGLTTISFDEPIFIDKNETIVLGGNGSVSLFFVRNIPVDDEAGNFALIDGQAHTNLLQNTGGKNFNDTLAVEVKVVTDGEEQIFEDVRENVKKDIGDLSEMIDTKDDWWGTYIYCNEKLFAGKTITRIGVPVKKIEPVNGRAYLDLYLFDAFDNPKDPAAILDRNFKGKTSEETELYLSEHRLETPLEIPAEKIEAVQSELNSSGGSWIDFDCHIEVGENQTLSFGGRDHGIYWLFLNNNPAQSSFNVDLPAGYAKFNLVERVGNIHEEYYGGPEIFNFMFFDVYYATKFTVASQLEKLNRLETEAEKTGKLPEEISALREVLAGKKVSVLGDSISTFDGYSNEYETQNSDIKSNGRGWVASPDDHNYYGNRVQYTGDNLGVSSADETWWLSTIKRTNMKLCVNNSFAGGLITDNGTIKRSSQLHDNTKYSDFENEKNLGQNEDIYPDIVAIYMGINDFNSSGNVDPNTFYLIYKRIVLNILKTYVSHSPNLTVFVLTIPPSSSAGSKWSAGTLDESEYRQNLELFNSKIRLIAEEIESVEVVDLFNYYNMTRIESRNYADDYLHPNAKGMKLISDCFIDALYKKYVEN